MSEKLFLPKQLTSQLGWNKNMIFGILCWAVVVGLAQLDSSFLKRKCFNDGDDVIEKRPGGLRRVLLFWILGWTIALLTSLGDMVYDIFWFELRNNQFMIDKFTFFGANCTQIYKKVGIEKDRVKINFWYKLFNVIFRFTSNLSLWGVVLITSTWTWTLPPGGLGDGVCFISGKTKERLLILFLIIFVLFTLARLFMPYPKLKSNELLVIEHDGAPPASPQANNSNPPVLKPVRVRKARPEELDDLDSTSEGTSSEFTDPETESSESNDSDSEREVIIINRKDNTSTRTRAKIQYENQQ